MAIAVFDDWIDCFRQWLDDVGIDEPAIRNRRFEPKYNHAVSSEIEFGAYAGQAKWRSPADIPNSTISDSLLKLIAYQGDTELASVEQQRRLLASAPSQYDRQSAIRVMSEEMRHGWQMSHILVTQFGAEGRAEAEQLLQRRAYNDERLLRSFNGQLETWTDFFAFTDFIDRDGKFQLNMLSTSAFEPLAASMAPMLEEESFHLGTGNTGLRRIIAAGKMPIPLVQKFINKWISSGHDLFGNDHSSSARRVYEWGLKGRYQEGAHGPADVEHLNEFARELYHQECALTVERLNHLLSAGQPRLTVPDIKFNRSIGDFAGQPYSISGELLSAEEFARHLAGALPSAEDVEQLKRIEAAEGWLAPREVPRSRGRA